MDDIWLYKTYSDEKDIEAVKSVVERDTWWSKGNEVNEFEDMIADYCDREYCVTFNSGTSALYASLIAFDIKGKIVTAPYTYIATRNCIQNTGLSYDYVDIELDTYGMKADDINRKYDAIIPIHMLGYTCRDIRVLEDIAEDQRIPLIVDGAPSLGSTLDGKPAGSFGDACIFSFAFNKIISTGEGGAVVTDNKHIYDNLKQIRFQSKESSIPGFNFTMSSMNAALGISQLNKIDELIQKRQNIAKKYNESFKDLPVQLQDGECTFQKYQLLVEGRNDFCEYLQHKNIPTIKAGCLEHSKDLPNCDSVHNKGVYIPMHACLSDKKIRYIIRNIRKYFKT